MQVANRRPSTIDIFGERCCQSCYRLYSSRCGCCVAHVCEFFHLPTTSHRCVSCQLCHSEDLSQDADVSDAPSQDTDVEDKSGIHHW